MTQEVAVPIQLLRVRNRAPVEGWLRSLNSRHVDDFERLWKPLLLSSTEADQYWDWERKFRLYATRLGAEQYAVECQGRTQGLMLIECLGHRSWFEESRRIVYVRSLATAPWNRPSLRNPPEYRFTGTVLLDFARYRSQEIGYGGLVGLHALPGAEDFYRQNGMIDCEADDDEDGLVYFEYYRRASNPEWEDEIDWDQI